MKILGTQKVPVTALRAHPGNARSDLGDLGELTASIAAQGVMQPLVVTRRQDTDGRLRYVVIDGHRRLAAARAAGVREISCLLVPPGSSESETMLMLASALHKGLEPMDQARAFRRLRDAGWSTLQISQHTGIGAGTVRDRLLLLELPAKAQQLVEDKVVPLRQAKDLARQTRKTGSGSAGTSQPRNTYLNRSHPAAETARSSCTPAHREHRSLVGGVACGQCWEASILTRAGVSLR